MWRIDIYFYEMHLTEEVHPDEDEVSTRVRILLRCGFTAPLGNHFPAEGIRLEIEKLKE